ncbi:MAG: GNAT family N-acetyltransferase, partial [Planctomycetota bacterium]
RYIPGDEYNWVNIQSAADEYNEISLKLFRKEFGRDPDALSQRQLYITTSANKEIGTATAWYDENYHGKRYGRIHWVAIHPDWQGRGLARPLLSQTCLRLRRLGHEKAYLTTSSARIPAINLYLKFGFNPEIQDKDDATVWKHIGKHTKYPL